MAPPRSMPRMLVAVLVALALAYAAVLVLAFAFQARLVYFPDVGREMAVTPAARGLAFETHEIATEDGERLHAWWVPVRAPRGTVLVLHGNAGNISHRVDYLAMFHRLGYASLAVDYRGYGRSTGSPSEGGTYRDAEAAWRWLVARGIAPEEIVLLGESLGGAVAAWLAARVTPRALILASSFTSVPDLGAQAYPFLPVRLLSRFSYDTRAALRQVRAPLLVAHSPEDEVVPYSHAAALLAAARGPKQLLELRGGHNDGFLFTREAWVVEVAAFLERAARGARGGTMASTFESRTITVRIARPYEEVYEFLARPESFPRWASGLGKSLRRVNGEWIAEGPEGPVRVRFTERNPFGVVDHHVAVRPGVEVYIPMRVVANGTGSEVLFTLFRLPGVTDEAFARDAAWVERDLGALKALLEGGAPAGE